MLAQKDLKPTSDKKIPVIAFVVLGRLAQEEQTGYELASFMGPPRNYIWEASHSQIYPLMAQLTKLNYVTFVNVSQTGKPNKKVYRISDAGLNALNNWLLDSPTAMPSRLEFNAKVNSLWLLPVDEALSVLDQQIAMVRAEIKMIEGHLAEAQERTRMQFPPPPRSKYSGIYANIRYALGTRRYVLRWYAWVKNDLRNSRNNCELTSARKCDGNGA